MSRKKKAKIRSVVPDALYSSELVMRFINRLMYDGKKSVAEKNFYAAIKVAEQKVDQKGLELFLEVVKKVSPEVEVKSRRIGGATYQVPIEVRSVRQRSLAIRWLVTYARQRNEKGIVSKLAGEFVDVLNGTGGSVKKKEDVFKVAEANKAFAHYKW